MGWVVVPLPPCRDIVGEIFRRRRVGRRRDTNVGLVVCLWDRGLLLDWPSRRRVCGKEGLEDVWLLRDFGCEERLYSSVFFYLRVSGSCAQLSWASTYWTAMNDLHFPISSGSPTHYHSLGNLSTKGPETRRRLGSVMELHLTILALSGRQFGLSQARTLLLWAW